MHKEAAVQPKCHTAASKRLQNDAVLEDGDLAEAVLLGLGLLTACNADDQIQQVLCSLVDGLFAIGDHAGVEVDPAGFLLGQRGVGGDLQGGSRGRERSAAAGGEQDQVCACGGHGRGRNQIVAGAVQHVQALGDNGITVADHVHDGGGAALLDAAAALVFQRGDTALFVARRGVIVDHLVVADEVILEAVDHVLSLDKNIMVDAAIHQEALGTEHLGYLGQHGGTAALAHHVGKAADGGVGGDAGQAVRAAALHAHHQIGHGDRLTLELPGIGSQLLEDIAGSGELVVHLLTGEELHTVVVVLAQLFHELIVLQVLAAQMQHQNGSSIGVAHQRSQQLAGLCMVVAGLAAAEGMGEGVQALDGAGDQILIVGNDLLGDVVDAAHGGDDPDLIADGGTAVLAAEAHKGLRLDLGQGSQIRGGVVAVLYLTGQVGVHVVGVHPAAGSGICGGVADGKAVLDHVLTVLASIDAFEASEYRDALPETAEEGVTPPSQRYAQLKEAAEAR